MELIEDGSWFLGLDSVSYKLTNGGYQWAQNVSNRGGIIGTRQGFAEISSMANQKPRGLILVKMSNGVSYLVAAIGSRIYSLRSPFTGTLTQIGTLNFPTQDTKRAVHFELCVQAQSTDENGFVHQITPKFILIIQDGTTAPAYWDGINSGHLDPFHGGTVIGDYMKYVGDRLWVVKGNKLFASDLLNPTQFTEQEITASGGFFLLPANSTGMGVTHDFKTLLVFTDQTTSAIQAGLEDRTLWPSTQDFQQVIFQSIGCASHRTIVNQYGITWWMSHDGVTGLDNALQAYITSRIQSRDNNMARSKEGINWSNGGGCSGSFGNYLFFSVPSGSVYDIHTWVMDEGVVNTLNQITPPAWCSNWTGIRPEQWATGVVNGVQRCFCISNDPVTTGRQATIWEAFIGQRMDVPKTNGIRQPKDIACSFESRFYSLSPSQYMRFRYAELDLAEIIGNVHIQVYYCGRRTSYKKILDKQLTAMVSGNVEEVFDPDQLISVYVPQYRTIRSETDTHDSTDNDTEVQTPYIRSKDREFSVLVTWVGQLSITGIRIAVDAEPDYLEGVCEPDELTRRYITAEGTGAIDPVNPPLPNNFTQALTSQYLAPVRPRWVEFPVYDSAVPNGVFFVVDPDYTPAGGNFPINGFPLNQFPLSVAISTETPGATIRYSVDGTNITTITSGLPYTAPVSVALNQHLKSRAFRDGLTTSEQVDEQYYQAIVNDVIYAPPAGPYPTTDYPKTINVSTTTSGANLRYTTDGTLPSFLAGHTHGTLISASSGNVVIPSGTVLQVVAHKDQYLDSGIQYGQYTALPQCATPTFNPDGGEHTTYPLSITIHTTTTGAGIRYTKNDTNVSSDGTFVNSQTAIVSVDNGDVLRAISQKTGYSDSNIKSATYIRTVAQVTEPAFSPDGTVTTGNHVVVTVTCGTPNASISYTIGPEGATEDPSHTVGTQIQSGDQVNVGPLGSKTLKAIAFRSDMSDSVIHSADYDHEGGG